MGIDVLDHSFRLEKEFEIRIPEDDLTHRVNNEWVMAFPTVGDWDAYLHKRRPDLKPDEIARRHRNVLELMLGLSSKEASKIKSTDRLIVDLYFT